MLNIVHFFMPKLQYDGRIGCYVPPGVWHPQYGLVCWYLKQWSRFTYRRHGIQFLWWCVYLLVNIKEKILVVLRPLMTNICCLLNMIMWRPHLHAGFLFRAYYTIGLIWSGLFIYVFLSVHIWNHLLDVLTSIIVWHTWKMLAKCLLLQNEGPKLQLKHQTDLSRFNRFFWVLVSFSQN